MINLDKDFKLRFATKEDADFIWELLQQGISKRKEEGSNQWQDGYPNHDVVLNDIDNNFGVVAVDETNKIMAYVAMIAETEPAYEEIVGEWLTSEKYIVLHRLIVNIDQPIKGLATWMMKEIEVLAKKQGINSIKVDTNFDNIAMLRVFEKLDYKYCGKVYFRGSERLAFEKLL